MKKKSPDMVSCAQQCSECHNICMQTITHCLRKGGKYVDPSHLHALMDCAEICRTCCHFMSRSSRSEKILNICAQYCNNCAESCEQFGDDEQMKLCAQICRECAELCRDLS